jgi:hypothetical protein
MVKDLQDNRSPGQKFITGGMAFEILTVKPQK